MIDLKLSTKQKANLLEMCNTLFPEYKEIVLTKHNTLRFGYKEDIGKKWIANMSIHWFEFCFTKIFPRIHQWYNSEMLAEFFYQTIGHVKKLKPNEVNKFPHPVDYLYEEFKKLETS